jgi:hypothetical protein
MALRQAQDRGAKWLISGGNRPPDALYAEVGKSYETYEKSYFFVKSNKKWVKSEGFA